MKGVGIPDAMVMAEDRIRWTRVVADHATPQEDMLPRGVNLGGFWVATPRFWAGVVGGRRGS